MGKNNSNKLRSVLVTKAAVTSAKPKEGTTATAPVVVPVSLPTQKLDVRYKGSWQVVIPMLVYAELMHYVQEFDSECSGAALVEHKQENGKEIFTLSRVFLPAEQTNTGGSTDIEADAVAKLQTALVREGVDTSLLRCHWHSHNTMGVFHSGTDEDNYKVLQTGDWLVSLVLNKAGEIKASVHYYKPFSLDAINVPVTILMTAVETKPEWDANIESVAAFAARKKVITTTTPSTGYGYSGLGYDWRREEARRGELAQLAKEYLEIFLSLMDLEPVHMPEACWDEAKATVYNPHTGKVSRLTFAVKDERDPTPYEQGILAKDDKENTQQRGANDDVESVC